MLDLTEEDLIEKFVGGVSMATSLALAISYSSIAAAPHMFINAFKDVLAIVVETDYSYPKADEVKDLKDLSKFVVAVVAAAPTAGGAAAVEPSIWAALNLVGKSFIATVTQVVTRLRIWRMEKSCRLLACGYPWWLNVPTVTSRNRGQAILTCFPLLMDFMLGCNALVFCFDLLLGTLRTRFVFRG